jgi:transposase-like protein
MNQTHDLPRRKFDETFKREAVLNWLQSGYSAAKIGEELGINAGLLYAWKKSFAPNEAKRKAAAPPKPGSVSDLQEQLNASRRELARLREQCAILKKTLGILSEPSTTAANGLPR